MFTLSLCLQGSYSIAFVAGHCVCRICTLFVLCKSWQCWCFGKISMFFPVSSWFSWFLLLFFPWRLTVFLATTVVTPGNCFFPLLVSCFRSGSAVLSVIASSVRPSCVLLICLVCLRRPLLCYLYLLSMLNKCVLPSYCTVQCLYYSVFILQFICMWVPVFLLI